MTQDSDPKDSKGNSSGLLDTLQTILGAVFGVQSEKKRQEDFSKADPGKLIAIGIVTVVVIMLSMAFIVKSALESAGH
ncbi:MAG TPA: DUF2970 domain-containing protein [Dongiaceae bacterium]|nr:DUF2970 domain-containing protein [Dongiaceae bacterium]